MSVKVEVKIFYAPQISRKWLPTFKNIILIPVQTRKVFNVLSILRNLSFLPSRMIYWAPTSCWGQWRMRHSLCCPEPSSGWAARQTQGWWVREAGARTGRAAGKASLMSERGPSWREWPRPPSKRAPAKACSRSLFAGVEKEPEASAMGAERAGWRGWRWSGGEVRVGWGPSHGTSGRLSSLRNQGPFYLTNAFNCPFTLL